MSVKLKIVGHSLGNHFGEFKECGQGFQQCSMGLGLYSPNFSCELGTPNEQEKGVTMEVKLKIVGHSLEIL